MPYFELRVVYLSPAVTHYQEGMQLLKVLHIIQPMKEEYSKGGHPVPSVGDKPSNIFAMLKRHE